MTGSTVSGADMLVRLSHDQRLWLLTTHPDTWEMAEAPAWLASECEVLGLVAWDHDSQAWRTTEEGHQVWRTLRGPI